MAQKQTKLTFNGITETIPLQCILDLRKLGFKIEKNKNHYVWRQ